MGNSLQMYALAQQRPAQRRKPRRRRPCRRTRLNRREGITLVQLFDMFPDEAAAVHWFEQLFWGPHPVCPKCGGVDTYRTKGGRPQPHRCRDCKSYFSVRTGTVMAHSKLPLRTWALAIYLLSTSGKGVASLKLHRDLGVTQRTAWMLAHKVRTGWLEATSDAKLKGVLEADETYIGGLEKNKHWDKKLRRGRGAVGKFAVLGIKNRRTKELRTEVVDNTQRVTLQDFVRRHAEPGSVVFTDEAPSYEGMSEFHHASVAHSRGEYVRGDVSTNSIESSWAPIKRGYKGVYHWMSRKHLPRYVAEFTGRANARRLSTEDHMRLIALGMVGKRLPWKVLTR